MQIVVKFTRQAKHKKEESIQCCQQQCIYMYHKAVDSNIYIKRVTEKVM